MNTEYVKEATIVIPGAVGKLEVLLSAPQQITRAAVAIICHPHPLFGGTMHNKVVYTLAKACKELGMQTIRFNFRGVGVSEGSYADGVGETDDLLAVIEWAKQAYPANSIWLAGFSFGAYVATRATKFVTAEQLICIAPPVQSFDFKAIKTPVLPWLIVQGEVDEIVSPEAVYAWHQTLQPTPTLIRIADADHFFHGKLIELRQTLITHLS